MKQGILSRSPNCYRTRRLREAGVDMLEGHDGPQIMEINSLPGLEGIEPCTQRDIAAAIIDHTAAHVDVPEIDLRQRLTVSRGFGVSEITIPEGADRVGQAIEQAGLIDNFIHHPE